MSEIAIGYCRVSTLEQAREGLSLEAQNARIENYCEIREIDLIICHEDRGISGRKASNRPGLDAAIEQVVKERGMLVVHSLSRLARSVKDCIDIVNRLEKAGAQLVLISENIDTNSASGKMFFHVIAAMAQFESDLNGERVRASLDYIRSQGKQYCRNPPFGYKFTEGEIQVDTDEKKIVARIKRLRNKGWTYRRIAKRFESVGVLNRRGNPFPFQAIANINNQIEEGDIHRPARLRRRGQ
jgi:DNA invertase Pin-like site-specific DNA recombinase